MNRVRNFVYNIRDIKPSTERTLIVAIVFYTNVVDSLLMTCVVPIIPEILVTEEKQTFLDGLQFQNQSANQSTALVSQTLLLNVTETSIVKNELPFHIEAETNSKNGWILATKALVQLVANPVAGYLANRYGNGIMMLVGTVVLGITSIIYILSQNLPSLLVARAVHGLGSAAIGIGSFSLLAEIFPDDIERSNAMGKALGGIALGVLLGYPYGGMLYGYVGQYMPFLIITVFVVIDVVLIIIIVKPVLQTKKSMEGTSLLVMLKDPYIVATASIVMTAVMSIAILESTVPIWIMDTMNAKQWHLALVFLPDTIGYLIGTYFCGSVTIKIGRWLCTLIGLIVLGISLFVIPFATQIPHLIAPQFILGLALGITDVAAVPLLALLVDTRHAAVYGNVYAVDQLSICLAYGGGVALAGQIVEVVGFSWFMHGFGVVVACLSTISFFIQNQKFEEETQPILEEGDSIQRYTHKNEDEN